LKIGWYGAGLSSCIDDWPCSVEKQRGKDGSKAAQAAMNKAKYYAQ
jgi:hypothetical protein